MPDWTYHPLRPAANVLLGERRAQRFALRFLSALVAVPGGGYAIKRVFDHPEPPVEWQDRLGAVVPVSVARDAIRVLPVQGARVIEVGPVGPDAVAAVRAAAMGRRCPVIARATDPATAAALDGSVDAVFVEPSAGIDNAGFGSGSAAALEGNADAATAEPAVDIELGSGGSQETVNLAAAGSPTRRYLRDPDIAETLAALRNSDALVLARPSVLVEAGPGWFQRVIEAALSTQPPPQTLRDVPIDPRRWPGWFWGLLVGAGMIVAGLGATAITLGPVLLWYDRDYLGTDVDGLHAINHHLVHFLQHDRITMAGNMIAIGCLYAGLSWGGIRMGREWARNALLASGLIGFPTLFYFLVIGFVEPLHVTAAVVLFPMWVLAVARRPGPPRWTTPPPCPEPIRRRALVGQLLIVAMGIGVMIGGIVISCVGLTYVFVPTDLAFLRTDADTLRAANEHLLPFIAHDRAGFGGALISTGAAILLLALWGWRQGEAWVWWTLLAAAFAGSASALIIHFFIHYTAFVHLLPVYFGTVVILLGLGLARSYLLEGPRL
ncbi:hypothetical protein LTV02_35775 [Nocardia yamanashiensis]|uniref:hypothetical protein n=1 Tax=Nocardia yamanashiensis TaxID=209247 RepID=UPI001E432D09|nr:hypothetical protein [Nocardia yamanashiensis]UGT41242.1 hypothetical protein LTV02_35775 [Nocardia yamanashiensis]